MVCFSFLRFRAVRAEHHQVGLHLVHEQRLLPVWLLAQLQLRVEDLGAARAAAGALQRHMVSGTIKMEFCETNIHNIFLFS